MRLFSIIFTFALCGRLFAQPLLSETEATTRYLVIPKDNDPSKAESLKTTLQLAAGQSDLEIYSYINNGTLEWHTVRLTNDQLMTLKKEKDVDYIVEDIQAQRLDYLIDVSSNDTAKRDLTPDVFQLPTKRTQQYRMQPLVPTHPNIPTPPHELIVLSTPEDIYWETRPGYKFPKEAGSGTYIYHIENGVDTGFKNQFASRLEEPLDTHPNAPAAGRKAPDWHSTCVAEKAAGIWYGAAKKANIVPVRLYDNYASDLAEAFNIVYNHIDHNPERIKKSVVVVSISYSTFGENGANPHLAPYSAMKTAMNKVFNLGVPIVMAAGNTKNRQGEGDLVNAYPQLWESSDFPLILIGNAKSDTTISPDSMRGSHVAAFADGSENTCACVKDLVSGTSFAAPQVAGALATMMSQEEGEFHRKTHPKSGMEFVKEVREFVKGDASYLAWGGAQMFWNLAR